jgi:hypothetical protein
VITLHGRKAAREPFAFLTCSLISHFWAGHAVILFRCLEKLLCIRAFALELNNWLEDLQETLSQGQLLYVCTVSSTPCLDKTQALGLVAPKTSREREAAIPESILHVREQTLTHINHRPFLTTQPPSGTQSTFSHGQLQRKAHMYDRRG